MSTDYWTGTEYDAGRYDAGLAEPDYDLPDVDDVTVPDCDECGDTGWVNYGCSRDPECSGGDCCDRRCLSCEAGRAA